MGTAERLRRNLVTELAERAPLYDQRVRRAMLAVPREFFVPDVAVARGLEAVYRNDAIPTKRDVHGVPISSSSQPSIMAAMLERLELREGQRVLEIGTGTGYNAALLAELVGRSGRVTSVELDPELAARSRAALRRGRYRVRVVTGDGRAGWPAGAPYDRIVVTAAAAEVPRAWLDQLADDGRIEVPLCLRPFGLAQAIPTFRRAGDELRSAAVLCGGFMALRPTPAAAGIRPPSLAARALVDSEESELLELFSDALRRLPRVARTRLLALALGEARQRRLPFRAPTSALALYVMFAAPAPKLMFTSRLEVGIVDARGRGFAVVGGKAKTVGRIAAYGARDSERRLLALIGDWDRRGRPTEKDLDVRVEFTADRSKIRYRWRTE